MKIPANESQANELLRRICAIDADLAGIKTDLEKRLAGLKRVQLEAAQPLTKERSAIKTVLKTWYNSIRQSLGDRKIITLDCGRLGMQAGKPAVEFLGDATEESVITALLENGNKWTGKFIRAVPELNRQAIHDASAEDLERLLDLGVSLKHEDVFFVSPEIRA